MTDVELLAAEQAWLSGAGECPLTADQLRELYAAYRNEESGDKSEVLWRVAGVCKGEHDYSRQIVRRWHGDDTVLYSLGCSRKGCGSIDTAYLGEVVLLPDDRLAVRSYGDVALLKANPLSAESQTRARALLDAIETLHGPNRKEKDRYTYVVR